MTAFFSAVLSPGAQVLSRISDITPQSPFNTPAYAAAISAIDAEPCALMLKSDQNDVIGGCLAALTGSKWNRKLEIFTGPTLISPSIFWSGVTDFCKLQSVCDLDVQTFASESPSLPNLDNRLSTRKRFEYVLDLSNARFPDSFSKNHKRSIKKAQNSPLIFAQGNTIDDYQAHIRLMESSITRRSDRGERVIRPRANDFDYMLVKNGAAQLFQAKSEDQILASILILLSKTSGYYHSAGTSQDGMQSGASPFLISEVAKTLASSGRTWLNLGGADPHAEGLRRFKKGFGAQEIELTADVYSMISPLERKLRTVARSIKNSPSYFLGTARVHKEQAG